MCHVVVEHICADEDLLFLAVGNKSAFGSTPGSAQFREGVVLRKHEDLPAQPRSNAEHSHLVISKGECAKGYVELDQIQIIVQNNRSLPTGVSIERGDF